jgi:hypothetical protein
MQGRASRYISFIFCVLAALLFIFAHLNPCGCSRAMASGATCDLEEVCCSYLRSVVDDDANELLCVAPTRHRRAGSGHTHLSCHAALSSQVPL